MSPSRDAAHGWVQSMSEFRALLLTDVVGSTALSESVGDAVMAQVWGAHDRVARDLLRSHGGLEIDKTDGMLLLFDAVADAVKYAQAYHRALEALPVPLKARAGLHVGPVILRENSAADIARGAKPIEVDGLAKPTAARVMSLANGGQTLMTADGVRALGETRLQIHSHGHWVVKGLSAPIELFEVGDANTVFAVPPDGDKVYRVVRSGERWMPVQQIPNNLPQQVTSFIGRERELDDIKAHLSTSRLLTLLGMGGLGKTRLSLQVAAEVMAEYPDGAWFIDLAPIRDPSLVTSEAAQVLGVREEPDRPLLQTLCNHLKSHRALIVLDSCEHLMKPSALLAHAVLRAAPGVRVLAASREPLHVPGEQAFSILPLPIPKRNDSIDSLLRTTAVRLFLERAQLHKPSFAVSQRDAAAMVELVARLEGIPLAIELAAARVRSLSLADINARLKDRYKILTGGGSALQERQQTLRALVDWSYDLLSDGERTVLNRLGLFVGGFDLEGAERVCGVPPVTSDEVFDILGSLVEKSLVMFEEREEGARYRALETIRDYAREKLDQTGDLATTAARHCEHFFALAKRVNIGMRGPEQADWIRRMEVELDNARSATQLAIGGGVDPFIAVKFAVALQGFWILRGYATEGRKIVRAALALPSIQASDLAQSHALYVGAGLADAQSDHLEARQMLESCLALRRRLGNAVDIAATLSTLSLTRLQSGDAVGAADSEREALQLFRDLGDRRGEALGWLHLGQIGVYVGDDIRAQTHLEKCLAIARELRHQEIEGECERRLGEAAFELGDRVRAHVRFTRSMTVCLEAGDKRGEANAMRWLGKADLEAGSFQWARTRLGDALRSFRAFEMREELLGCLEDHVTLAHAEGAAAEAVGLASAAAASRGRLRLGRSPRDERRWLALVDKLREAMGSTAFIAVWEEGRGWELETALQRVLSARSELEAV